MRRVLIGCASAAAIALGLLAAPSETRAAATQPCEIDGVERIVAIGDIHGAYDRFAEILATAGLVDGNLKWSGGKTHLVQLGDVVDRGPDSLKALELVQRLEGEAAEAGGRVHELLGNHEVMRMLADNRYTTPGEYQAFVTPDSEKLRQRFLATRPLKDRLDLTKRTPLGWVEMRLAFQTGGKWAERLQTLDTVVKINGVVFVHGGISNATDDLSCATINETVRRELTTDFGKTTSDPLRTMAAKEDGPLWYRGLTQESDTDEPEVDAILAAQKASTIVVAHTVTPTGRVVSRFGGKVLEIDTGMQPAYVKGGRASAVEIRGGVFTAIYVDRKDTLFEQKPSQ